MRYLYLSVFLLITVLNSYPQQTRASQQSINAQQNINAIMNLAPYSDGGHGFDTRYQGVVGTPRLFDTLLSSYLLLNDKDFYIKLDADLDLVGNNVLYQNPSTKKLFALPSDNVRELVVENDEGQMIFKTTRDLRFENSIRDNKFCQVLAEGSVMFIKVPAKVFVEADYKGAYSADRRYDEYRDETKYYIMGADDVLHQIQLNRKSLLKLFPDKKELIENTLLNRTSGNNEELVIDLIRKL